MVAYAYAAQYPAEVDRIVLMDAFLPGVGDWTSVWLLRDLWHFHFYGETPLALVNGRERIYFEHFWNDFAADPHTPSPRPIASSTPPPMRSRAPCAPASRCSARSSRTPRTSPSFAKTKLTMPMLVLTGEKAVGRFLIDAGPPGRRRRRGRRRQGSGHWLMDEAPDQVIPEVGAFLTR